MTGFRSAIRFTASISHIKRVQNPLLCYCKGMENFDFRIPTEVLFGKGQIEHLADAMRPYGDTVLLCYGGGSIRKNGVYDDIQRVLKGFKIVELSGIEPNPRISTVIRGRDLCRKNQVKIVLAAGGGSVLDCAKMVADCAVNDADPWEMVMNPALIHGALPVFTVLTLAATGSEMNNTAVISWPEKKLKKGCKSPYHYPVLSICDPSYTFSVSRRQTAAGSADIMSHIMENYFSRVEDAVIADELAEGLLRTVIQELPKALGDPHNYSARANLMWAGTLGISQITSAGKKGSWSCHPISHELSAFYDVNHGESLAIITPHWMRRILTPATVKRFDRFAEKVWNIQEEDPMKEAEMGIDALQAFFASCGLPSTLREIGIPDDSLAESMTDEAIRMKGFDSAFVNLSREDILGIIRDSL